MKGIFLGLSLLAIALSWPSFGAVPPSAYEVVRLSDLQARGQSSYSEATLTIVRPEWTRRLEMKVWTKATDYSLVLITAPAKEQGTTSLKRHSELWNWLPSVERIIKIAPSMLGQSWMGSDFTNDDLINQSSIVVDYDHAFIGESEIQGDACYLIEATAKPDAPVVWSRVRLAISKATYNQREARFYDEFGDLINTLTSYDIKSLGGRQIATKLEMQPADKPQQRTVLVTHDAQFDFEIGDEFFSLTKMKSLRQ